MAAILLYTRPRDTPPVDGLCPLCWKPTLKLYYLERISLEGIDIIGERVMCADERKWTTQIKEYKQSA